MQTYDVKVLKLGNVKVDKGVLTRGVDCGIKIDIPIISVAIEGNGLKILADTGICDCDWVDNNIHFVEKCYANNDQYIIKSLASIGWKPEDVDIVINTHLHFGHCGNNNLFKNATIYIQKKEWEFALHPTSNQKELYFLPFFTGVSGIGCNVKLIDGEFEITEGLILISTPGHTPGHQSVVINTEKGVVCYAGDAVNLLENIKSNIIGNIVDNTAQAYKSMEDIKRKAEFIIPGNDPIILGNLNREFPALHE